MISLAIPAGPAGDSFLSRGTVFAQESANHMWCPCHGPATSVAGPVYFTGRVVYEDRMSPLSINRRTVMKATKASFGAGNVVRARGSH